MQQGGLQQGGMQQGVMQQPGMQQAGMQQPGMPMVSMGMQQQRPQTSIGNISQASQMAFGQQVKKLFGGRLLHGFRIWKEV